MKANRWTHTHTHYEQLTDCFPEDSWCLCRRMELSVCVRACGSQLVHALCVWVCLHVCLCPCGLGRPVKVMCGSYLESGRGRLAHCSPLIFYMAALSSLIIFYTVAITNCLEKRGPPATAHAASSKTRHRHKHTPTEAWLNVLACNTAIDRCSVNWVLLQ